MEYNINEPKLIFSDIIEITESSNIRIDTYEKRQNKFYDINLNLPNKKVFLGRFIKEFDNISVNYKDGKILVYIEKFVNEISKLKVKKVLSLYDILDDTFYSVTEEEALSIYDKNIDSSYLKNKTNYIYRSDIEKNKRLIKNN